MNECSNSERLVTIEKEMSELRKDVITIMAVQTSAVEAIKVAGEEQKESLRKEASELHGQMLKQASDMQNVSSAMISLQRTISKYAAAGTLACSVLLYILAKAAGL